MQKTLDDFLQKYCRGENDRVGYHIAVTEYDEYITDLTLTDCEGKSIKQIEKIEHSGAVHHAETIIRFTDQTKIRICSRAGDTSFFTDLSTEAVEPEHGEDNES